MSPLFLGKILDSTHKHIVFWTSLFLIYRSTSRGEYQVKCEYYRDLWILESWGKWFLKEIHRKLDPRPFSLSLMVWRYSSSDCNSEWLSHQQGWCYHSGKNTDIRASNLYKMFFLISTKLDQQELRFKKQQIRWIHFSVRSTLLVQDSQT